MTTRTKIVWYDINNIQEDIYNKYNDYTFQFYNDTKKCIDYIKSINKSEAVFLVLSPLSALEILPHIHESRQLDSVFIYLNTHDVKIDESLLDKYSKIIGIFYDFQRLFQCIEETIDLAMKNVESFKFYEKHQKSTRELSKEFGSFLWLRLFKDVILKLPHNEEAKQEMIAKLKECYHNNNRQLKLIDKFNQEYKSTDVLRWYTGQPFLYKQINRALRTEDIKLLYTLRYFISDLSKSLDDEYQSTKDFFNSNVKFYRGVKVSHEEGKKLKENTGKLISMNGYLSTSFSKEVALMFAGESRENETSVLFEIECDFENINSVSMASIAYYSTNRDEEEVLFDFDTTFEILSTSKNISENYLVVKMKVTKEGIILAQEHIKQHNRQLETSSAILLYGYLLTVIGQYEKSIEYFHNLEKNPNGEDIAFIYNYLGDAYRFKGDYETALKYFKNSYEIMINSEPPRDILSSYLLNNIGSIFTTKGQYDVGLDYYKRVLNITKIDSNYAVITTTKEGIGNIYHRKGQYNEALKYLKSSLKIREKYLSGEHKEIGRLLSVIGCVYEDMDQLNTAFRYHKKSLEINEKCLPVGHSYISCSLRRIGNNLTNQGKYDAALDYYVRSLEMLQVLYPNGHLNIAVEFCNIGYIYYIKQDYSNALDYLNKSLHIRETLYADIKNRNLVTIFKYFGLVYMKLEKYDDALANHIYALKVCEDIYPIGHSLISDCLTNIGNAYRGMKDYVKAMEYYEKTTNNEKQNPTKPNLIRLARNYESIAICLSDQGNDQAGLEYRMKYVRTMKNVDPRISYVNVIDYIADMFFNKNIYDNALECYLTSLEMKSKCLPIADVRTAETLENIGNTYFEQDKNQLCENDEQYQIKARCYYEKALDIYKIKNDITTIYILNRIASIYENIRQYHCALEYYEQAKYFIENYFSLENSIKETNEHDITRMKRLIK
ncbi:unnamed protein product [Adineta steineri]|uniref:ADP ribosyltransferase domain-containing protein n=1 Tax=Adineta steineri TaxID=433720 RepID=A0A815PHM3_9BILA|nr:unnamed protein product [Adineta steineri]CAF4101901.1 unnamed protein product [Adineta steineri]